ncbi:MAG TPA: hypothetical protein VMZ28_20415 [Kofleriaceae bacterium]|nr:hypothetical protein [Kofleriaceae bacterium]
MSTRALAAALVLVASLAADADAGTSAASPQKARAVGRRRGIGHHTGAKLVLGSAVAPRAEADQGSHELGSQAVSLSASRSPASRSTRTRSSTSTSTSRRVSAKKPASRRASRLAPLVPEIDGRLPRMSTKEPGLLLVLADFSESMREPFAGNPDVAKADALADVVNNVLSDFIDRNNVGGIIRERLDVAVHGYGMHGGADGWSGTGPALEGILDRVPIVSIRDLADNPAEEIEVDDEEGFPVPRPVWVTPQAYGTTPMRAGFASARKTIADWQRRPATRHLVLAVHVTDGVSTDGDPSDQVEQLAADVRGAGGELLMTNIHLSSDHRGNGVVFPDEADAARLDEHGKMLFRMSSPVPPILAHQLGTKPGARMMAYNATVEQFARVFEAGSSVAGQ